MRDGDEYVISGTKIFTSLASDADYIWLPCRTNPEAPRRRRGGRLARCRPAGPAPGADIRSPHVLTFGGGANEMQRGLIAVFALGMPGSPR